MVPNIWVHKVGIAGAASISGGGSFKFFWPNDTRVADGHGWALERISAGYAWGAGVNGSTPARICIVGEPGWGDQALQAAARRV